MSFVSLVATADNSGPPPIPSSSAIRQIEVHLGAAVIKAPEDVSAIRHCGRAKKNGVIGKDKLHIDNLSDRNERDDTIGPYGKSPLYFVSRDIEAPQKTPLPGLERCRIDPSLEKRVPKNCWGEILPTPRSTPSSNGPGSPRHSAPSIGSRWSAGSKPYAPTTSACRSKSSMEASTTRSPL